MTRRDKLIEKIRARPPTADFGDVRTLLESFGWEQARTKGSHVSFVKAGEPAIVLSTVNGRKVKRVYLDQICERLGLDG